MLTWVRKTVDMDYGYDNYENSYCKPIAIILENLNENAVVTDQCYRMTY